MSRIRENKQEGREPEVPADLQNMFMLIRDTLIQMNYPGYNPANEMVDIHKLQQNNQMLRTVLWKLDKMMENMLK